VENSKSAVVPSWQSSPTYVDDDEGKVKLVGDVTCPYTQRVRIALLHKVTLFAISASFLSVCKVFQRAYLEVHAICVAFNSSTNMCEYAFNARSLN